MTQDYMDFECMTCGKLFERRWFDISRSFERAHYGTTLNEIEVRDSEGIGVFCTRDCLDAGRGAMMEKERVPLPPVRPGIGPVERCAKCTGPVFMNDWHLAYTDGEYEEGLFSVRPIDVAHIAVLCRHCAPRGRGAAVARDTEVDDSLEPLPKEGGALTATGCLVR